MKDFLKAAGKLLVLKQDPNKPLVPRILILDYILHVSECFTIYVSPKCPVLFQGATAGAVLALCKDPAK